MIVLLAFQAATPAQPLAPLIFDYPAAAGRDKVTGRVGFDLTIDPEGRVVECRVTTSSGSPVLDDATCRQAVNKRFRPTRDGSGTAVPGHYTGSFNHQGPRASVDIAYRINAAGRADRCEIVRSSGEPALDATACRGVAATFNVNSLRVVDGKLVRLYRGKQRVDFELAE